MSRQPNIVFILSDQQRWDTLGCYGQELNISPNLDRMAEEGVLFTNTFSCQPVCGPVRSTLQTGKYPTETGCFRNSVALPQDEKTIAHHLRENGYEVGYIGKWHLASTSQRVQHSADDEEIPGDVHYETKAIPPERRGWYEDYWLAADVLEFTSHGYDGYLFDKNMNKVEFKGYRVDCLTDFALDYLKSRTREKPFFLFLSYIEPHHQNDHNRYEGPEGSQERFADFKAPPDLADQPGDWQKEFPDYLGCCASLDHNVGRIMATLEELGMASDTLVIYTSDHGSHFRTRNRELEEGNYDDYKRSCHEASLHVPFIARGPGFAGGKRIENLVSLIDLPPTILHAAGIETPETMRGRPVQQLVEGKQDDWIDEVFVQISESQVGRALRTTRWKYSVRARGKNGGEEPASDVYTEDYLYDLQADPYEKNNLVRDPEYREIRTELARRLKKRMREAGEEEPEIKPLMCSNSKHEPWEFEI